MSRLFSTSARRVKKLVWKLNGTTEDVDWAKNMVNEAIDEVPGLAEKVDSGMIKSVVIIRLLASSITSDYT